MEVMIMNRYIEYNDELLPIDEVLNKLDNEIGEKDEIITQLINNWNELEELISNLLKEADSTKSDLYIYEQNKAILRMILDKMKETKGGNNVSNNN